MILRRYHFGTSDATVSALPTLPFRHSLATPGVRATCLLCHPCELLVMRRLSTLRQKSQAALLRDALDQLLAHDERERLTEMALEVISRYRGSTPEDGQTSIAEDHNAALEDAYLS